MTQNRQSKEPADALHELLSDVTPLPSPNRARIAKAQPAPAPTQRVRNERAVLDESLHFPLGRAALTHDSGLTVQVATGESPLGPLASGAVVGPLGHGLGFHALESGARFLRPGLRWRCVGIVLCLRGDL